MGIAELGVGWLTLPGASVCAERSSGQGCKNGDTSFELDVWQIYRGNRRFAFGAGAMLGLIPTTDAPRHDPDEIVRDHSRSYLTIEGTIRHYPYVGEGIELWWGISGGLAVVNDRFVVTDKNSDLALVGPRGSNIRTEGATSPVPPSTSPIIGRSAPRFATRTGSCPRPPPPIRSSTKPH
jgi:hypothetical protein